MSGHVVFTQYLILRSFRSIALFSGFCQLNPKLCRILRIWSLWYSMPHSFRITKLMFAVVQMSAVNPYVAAPRANIPGSCFLITVPDTFGGLPVALWDKRDSSPLFLNFLCQTWTACRLTFIICDISDWVSPFLNILTAANLRFSSALKSFSGAIVFFILKI